MKNRIHSLSVLAAILLFVACSKESLNPVNNKSNTLSQSAQATQKFYIGQHYGGGIIFYIDSTGQHGLIAATQDQGYTDFGSDVIRTDARGRAIGKGYINTVKIINAYGKSGNYAAIIAAKYRGGGYEGWYLPSLKELHELYLQKDIVGGFKTTPYWTSTEVSGDWAAAWIHYFNSEVETPTSKWNLYYVRAIRSF